ncbi:hypothetical protein KM043_000671 [Ampulex compressa]|nr:hypothetical protein KM043_000671 [Ampulex compressa]
MAWFGDGLSSLSNLKGQITSFTKEVLSEGIVDEMDERTRMLNEANERCVQLQELLNSKDAEISLLRRQNCELQKAVVEFNAKPKDSAPRPGCRVSSLIAIHAEKTRGRSVDRGEDLDQTEGCQDDGGESFFWDPPSAKGRNPKSQNRVRTLQEQLAQATLRIRELESELIRVQKINTPSPKEESPDGHQKAEFLRAKQDMVNRIIQMEEKTREAERNTKRVQLDETTLINDFRTVISKLNSLEKLDLVRGALKALETENEMSGEWNKREKSDFDEKLERVQESTGSRSTSDLNSDLHNQKDGSMEKSSKREAEMSKKIEELREENKRLFASIEELDQQHVESIEEVLTLKEKLEKKHECLQKAYEQMYVDYNGAQEKVTQLEAKLRSMEANDDKSVETICRSLQTEEFHLEEKDVPTEIRRDENAGKEAHVWDESMEKVKDILKNACIDSGPGESIFEALAKQYVDTKWKKDTLERKVTEISRDLKESMEMKDSLQLECDDMQAHIDTLMLEIQDLKLNLPSIPEASEERVASLETETESLHEELKRLKEENEGTKRQNADLTAAVETLKASLQNQESTQTEMESMKLQLESAKRELENASRTMEDNEGIVDLLENTEKQLVDQLKISLEKFDANDGNRVLKISVSTLKRLQTAFVKLQNYNKELDKENEDLFREKEQLVEELLKLETANTQNEERISLKDLRERFDRTTQEKNDLERDVANVKEKLDEAENRLDISELQLAKANQENEKLTKDSASMLEQLTAALSESSDKIDLLNNEMSLLEQEHAELKQDALNKKGELEKLKLELRETEEKNSTLEDDIARLNGKAEKLLMENEELREKAREYEERERIEDEDQRVRNEESNSVENERTRLREELEVLRSKEKELIDLQENMIKLESQNVIIRNLEEKARSDEIRIRELETELNGVKMQRNELLSNQEPNPYEDEKEEMLEMLKKRASENEDLAGNNNRLMRELIDAQTKLQGIMASNRDSADMAKQTIESLSHLIKEKDEEINGLKATIAEKDSSPTSEEFTSIKNERDELVKLVTVKHNESLRYHAEIQRLTQLLNEQAAHVQNLTSQHESTVCMQKERDAELLWTRNQLQTMQERLKKFESMNEPDMAILTEKCNALEAALVREQSSNRILQNQLTESQNKEANAGKELERLRTHLVEVEAGYTEDALLAEEMRRELEAKLLQAEEKVKASSTVYTSASIRANQQVETLEQQMALIVKQRDDIQSKLFATEDKVLSQTAALTNLQIVLEQFQRDKERDIVAATERIQGRLNESYEKQEELSAEISNLREQLAEAKECLQAASRLSEQLDRKTERIGQLTQEVERLAELVNTADRRIEEAQESGEGKVDKTLIKNLFLGYLSSSAADKSSVLRVFATILDFNDTEKDKAGLNNSSSQNSWFSRLSAGGGTSTKDQDASLSAAFVRFLETESKPKPQLPALPISTSPLTRPGHSRQHSTSSTQSTLLLSNIALPTFPDFVPARNTGSILKEVLKDS